MQNSFGGERGRSILIHLPLWVMALGRIQRTISDQASYMDYGEH